MQVKTHRSHDGDKCQCATISNPLEMLAICLLMHPYFSYFDSSDYTENDSRIGFAFLIIRAFERPENRPCLSSNIVLFSGPQKRGAEFGKFRFLNHFRY